MDVLLELRQRRCGVTAVEPADGHDGGARGQLQAARLMRADSGGGPTVVGRLQHRLQLLGGLVLPAGPAEATGSAEAVVTGAHGPRGRDAAAVRTCHRLDGVGRRRAQTEQQPGHRQHRGVATELMSADDQHRGHQDRADQHRPPQPRLPVGCPVEQQRSSTHRWRPASGPARCGGRRTAGRARAQPPRWRATAATPGARAIV